MSVECPIKLYPYEVVLLWRMGGGGGVIVEHGQHNQSEYGTHLHTGPAPTTARSSYDAIGFLTWNVVSIRALCPRYSLSFVDLLSLSMATLTYNFPCFVCIKSKSISLLTSLKGNNEIFTT